MVGDTFDKDELYIPEALVEKLITKDIISTKSKVERDFAKLVEIRSKIRDILKKKGKIRQIYPDLSAIPTTCGVDGSYAIRQLLGWDIVQVASIIVEGFTPPENRRYWVDPKFFFYSSTTLRKEGNSSVLRGIMMKLELHLARHAPHDVKFMDGSIKTPFIYFHQAFKQIESNNVSKELRDVFLDKKEDVIEKYDGNKKLTFPTFEEALNDYLVILKNARSPHEGSRVDRYYVSVPKAITTSYLVEDIGEENILVDDRGMLNFILAPYELVGPFNVIREDEQMHFRLTGEYNETYGDTIKKIISELNKWRVYYYKLPKGGVIRFEVPKVVSDNSRRLQKVITGIIHNTEFYPSILEPYPLYLADKMVKSVTYVLNISQEEILHHLLRKVTEDEHLNINPYELVLLFNNYRTEEG